MKRCRFGLVFIGLVFLVQCTSLRKVQKKANASIAAGDYNRAVSQIEKGKKAYRNRNALLYYFDLGFALHLSDRYKESNQVFEKAKAVAEDLYTKSISAGVASFIVNDNVLPYRGEDFERIYVHVFAALNYLNLGDVDSALVEIRQADFLLTKLQVDHGERSTYNEDAFLRYLGGLIFESQGEINKAHIDYMRALATYRKHRETYGVAPPKSLVHDARRTASELQLWERVEEINSIWGGGKVIDFPEEHGELVFLHFNGLIPYKVDFFFEISFIAGLPYLEAEKTKENEEDVSQAHALARSALGNQLIRIAFPEFEDAPYRINRSYIHLTNGNKKVETVMVQDIGAIAKQSLKDKNARIKGKAIARAISKSVASHLLTAVAEEQGGALAGLFTQIFTQTASTAAEVADKRSWRTLPDEIRMARIYLPSGEHEFSINCYYGRDLIENRTVKVMIYPKRKSFVAIRTAK